MLNIDKRRLNSCSSSRLRIRSDSGRRATTGHAAEGASDRVRGPLRYLQPVRHSASENRRVRCGYARGIEEGAEGPEVVWHSVRTHTHPGVPGSCALEPTARGPRAAPTDFQPRSCYPPELSREPQPHEYRLHLARVHRPPIQVQPRRVPSLRQLPALSQCNERAARNTALLAPAVYMGFRPEG